MKNKLNDIMVDLDELGDFKEQNKKERLQFVKYWANYVKTHSDKDWSLQQNIVIDAQIV